MWRNHRAVSLLAVICCLLMMPSIYNTTSFNGYEAFPNYYYNPRLWFPLAFPATPNIDPFPPVSSPNSHQYQKDYGTTDFGTEFLYQEKEQGPERQLAISAGLGAFNTFVGFASSVLGITQFIQEFFPGPNAPPTTPAPNVPPPPPVDLTPIINSMKNQFNNVQQQLGAIINAQHVSDILKYSDVELAVITAFHDMQFTPSLAIMQSNAENLYVRLEYFMRGMLGQNHLGADILNITNTISQCGSTTIGKQMDTYITIVNLGMGGIAYYSQMINNKATNTFFDGPGQLAALDARRTQVRQRVQSVLASCGDFTKLKGYVTAILSSTRLSTSNVVVSALQARLLDVYTSNYQWFIFVGNDLQDRVVSGGFQLISYAGRIAVVAPFSSSLALAPIKLSQSGQSKLMLLSASGSKASAVISAFQNNLSTYFSGRQPTCIFVTITLSVDSTWLTTNTTTLPFLYTSYMNRPRPSPGSFIIPSGSFINIYAV